MNDIHILINQYPNYDIYIISCLDQDLLMVERNYFLNLFGSDNIGNDTIIISPIVYHDNQYSFMITSKIRGIINDYRKRIGNYVHNGYLDLITQEGAI